MAKTRSQTAVASVKEEECDDTHLLNNVSNTTRTRSKVTKRRAPTRKNRVLPVRDVKLEEGSEKKTAIRARTKAQRNSSATEEQVKEFIDCVFNKNMAVKAAARKVNIGSTTGFKYYFRYKSDPTKDPFIPLHSISPYTYEEIKTVIGYIVDDGMSIREAGRLANVSYCATYNYYKRYCEDPEHKIPLPRNQEKVHNSVSTQGQIETLIHCIVQDKMSLGAAAVKAKMGRNSAKRYYRQYLEDPSHKIPVPPKLGQAVRSCSQDQINALIRYIVNGKMSIENASIKANMSERTGGKYYHRYLNDPDGKIPTVMARTHRSFTQEKINQVIGYIANDKMSINAASIKANMSENATKRYYDRYVNDPTHSMPAPSKSFGHSGKRYTKKQISDVIRYIVKNNMYLPDAAKKANMTVYTAKRYYNRYLHDPNHKIPEPNPGGGRQYTQKQVDELIDYICKDKLSIPVASLKTKMSVPTARKYYKLYLNSLPKSKKEI